MARRNIGPLSVVPLGDSAAYVEFSETLDLEVNSVVQRLGLVTVSYTHLTLPTTERV